MEAFSTVLEKPKLVPVTPQDVCLSNIGQISSGDRDHQNVFFLHTLDSGKKRNRVFFLLLCGLVPPTPCPINITRCSKNFQKSQF